MALIKARPTSPGRRFQVKISRDHLHKGEPEKSLLVHKNSTGARNHFGRQTVRHQGNGHKQKYRLAEPHRASRARALQGWRASLHPRAEGHHRR
jgi:large subunit ribosomal protein L2